MLSLLFLSAALLYRGPATALRLVQTIPLPGVEGRIDHMAADVRGQRLFVAALGNNTVEVVDLRAGARTHTIRGMREPQGVAFAATLNRLFVANGQGEGCDVFDGTTFAKLKTIELGDDSDNVRFDPASHQVVIGYGSGALAFVNGTTYQEPFFVGLQGHPESFQLESGGPRIFINIPDAEQIAVIDRAKKSVVAHWPVTEAKSNFPMALDEQNHQVIVGCRRPPKALVYDTTTGRMVESVDIVGDTDDMFIDRKRGRLYVIGGEGFVDVFARESGRYRRTERIATAQGARTGLYIPELDLLCVAAPHRGANQARIQVFKPQ
jgi:DNA-binding beta-propeller fold protein YncE